MKHQIIQDFLISCYGPSVDDKVIEDSKRMFNMRGSMADMLCLTGILHGVGEGDAETDKKEFAKFITGMMVMYCIMKEEKLPNTEEMMKQYADVITKKRNTPKNVVEFRKDFH